MLEFCFEVVWAVICAEFFAMAVPELDTTSIGVLDECVAVVIL